LEDEDQLKIIEKYYGHSKLNENEEKILSIDVKKRAIECIV
jgi:hypothetical protein